MITIITIWFALGIAGALLGMDATTRPERQGDSRLPFWFDDGCENAFQLFMLALAVVGGPLGLIAGVVAEILSRR